VAEEAKNGNEKPKDVKKRRVNPLPEGVRLFYKPKVTLMRFGRAVGVLSGVYGRLDLRAARMEFMQAEVKVGTLSFTAPKVGLDLDNNRIEAAGGVKLEESGVQLESSGLVAPPSLAGLRLLGQVRIHVENKESAEALLKSERL
jgi:hypothetical protein